MTFKVILEAPASSDLRGILRYISQTLKEPATAKRIYLSIKTQISSLDQLPFRCPVVDSEPFASRGIRRLPTENYTVFFVIEEAKKEVHILRVLYSRREWQNLL